MAKSTSISIIYRISVFYRFAFTFVLGYLCTMYLCSSLTTLFAKILAKAEAIYLTAFLSILFYVAFIIISFCINSLWKITLISLILVSCLFGLSVGVN